MNSLLSYIQYIFTVFRFNVVKPTFSLPRSYITAFGELRDNATKRKSSFKVYPISNTYHSASIQIDNIDFKGKNKYIVSGWVWEEAFLKYEDQDYEDLLNEVGQKIKAKKVKKEYVNPPLKKIKKLLTLDVLKDNLKEYLLDITYKEHTGELFDLYPIIYNKNSSIYIKNYYTELLRLLFSYTDYNKLLDYNEKLEDFSSKDINLRKLKELLLRLLEERNLLDIKLSKMSKLYGV